ncbi:hypothetical protein FIV42_02795 [Persicimonas caeni]|uniref:Uncharacterized protein n=1 Tax=Persicimonas caeni TaxID=2292766 RepID=A0A4Y6PN49_PERCE|nr:hypothetical protein [Persicimonas caeni]QDG49704.1 hypothetical protein FIV42_02795 [Persicimonas caeni]QED30925.1 hypothetical protein FRD00_02790 [Persicimonas caeni]
MNKTLFRRGWWAGGVVFFGGTVLASSVSFACSQPASCDTVVERGGLADCVKVYPGSCETLEVTIDNQCDQAVEFVELECGESCAEPVVFQAGDKGELLFTRPASENNEAYTYVEFPVGWSAGEQEGVLDVRAEYNEQTVECGDDSGCAATGQPTAPVDLLAVGVALGLLAWRRFS